MMHKKVLRALLALLLTLCLLSLSLLSCAADPKGKTIDADTVVGTVDGKEVYYDELYFLVKNYLASAKESAGGDSAKLREELDRLVKENITTNFAILKLCEMQGLEVDEKELEENAKTDLESKITLEFEGDRELYLESIREVGLTERYLLYTAKIDMMYASLMTLYPQKGLVIGDTVALRTYIKENFVRVRQVMNPDLDQITEAKELLNIGKGMKWAIGSAYNKDFGDVSGNGYYFCRGVMDKTYEDIAYALKVGQVSEIFKANGEHNDYYGDCYYIIQRLSLDNDYITENFETLKEQYYGAVIGEDMNEVKASLTFVPNELYGELDLGALPEAVDTVSVWTVLLWVGVGVAAVAVALIVVVILLKKKHAKKNVGVRRV